MIEALELVRCYAKAGNTTYYPRGEVVPEHRGTAGEWEDLVFKIASAAAGGWCGWCMRSSPSRRCARPCGA